ncbi:hypothetical protein ES703_31961 [subsurface metagenome]
MKLKPEIREKLEKWYVDFLVECLDEIDYREQVAREGLHGAKEMTDKELLDEYRFHVDSADEDFLKLLNEEVKL